MNASDPYPFTFNDIRDSAVSGHGRGAVRSSSTFEHHLNYFADHEFPCRVIEVSNDQTPIRMVLNSYELDPCNRLPRAGRKQL